MPGSPVTRPASSCRSWSRTPPATGSGSPRSGAAEPARRRTPGVADLWVPLREFSGRGCIDRLGCGDGGGAGECAGVGVPVSAGWGGAVGGRSWSATSRRVSARAWTSRRFRPAPVPVVGSMWCTAPCRITRSGSGSPVSRGGGQRGRWDGGPVDAVAGVVGEQAKEHPDRLVVAGLEGAKDAQVDVQLGEHRGHRARRQAPQPGPVQHVQHLPARRADVPGRHRHRHLPVRRVAGARCRGWVDGPQPTGVGVHPVEQVAVHGLQVRHVEPAATPAASSPGSPRPGPSLIGYPQGLVSGDRRQGGFALLTVVESAQFPAAGQPRCAAPVGATPTIHPGAHFTPLA